MLTFSRWPSVVLVTSLLAVFGCEKRDVVVTLTRDEIQEWIEPRFPASKVVCLVLITLRDPKILLANSSETASFGRLLHFPDARPRRAVVGFGAQTNPGPLGIRRWRHA